MDTYMAVMGTALEYASSIWSPLASPTGVNKLQVMLERNIEDCHMMHNNTNILHLHDGTLILLIPEYMQLHASQFKQETISITTPYTNTQHTSLLLALCEKCEAKATETGGSRAAWHYTHVGYGKKILLFLYYIPILSTEGAIIYTLLHVLKSLIYI